MNKPESKEITLSTPVAGITSITLRRPKVLDMLTSKVSAGDDADQAVKLIANLAMVSPEAIEEMELADFKALNEAFAELTAFEPIKDYSPSKPIPLDVPITIDGGTKVSAITMRKPKVRDLKSARKCVGGDPHQEVALFAILAGLSEENIKGLDWADYLKLKTLYADFFA